MTKKDLKLKIDNLYLSIKNLKNIISKAESLNEEREEKLDRLIDYLGLEEKSEDFVGIRKECYVEGFYYPDGLDKKYIGTKKYFVKKSNKTKK